MLITSTSTTPVTMPGMSSPPAEMDENPNKFSTFLLQISGNFVEEINVILKDHCYARPWNWKPENIYVKPVKKIFFPKSQNTSPKDTVANEELINVDVDNVDTTFPYDLTKIRQAMDEFQRVAKFIRTEDNDDWEDKIDKTLWSNEQKTIFSKIVGVLNKEKAARLSRVNSVDEPILRRTCLDSTAKRFRETLASTNWDWRITQWLHALLFDHLPQQYLAIYLDILQTIRQKIPQLVDKMIAVPPSANSKGTSITWETLAPLLRKTWDPVAPILNANKPKKLPGNPILIVVPNGVSSSVSSRQHKWITQLGMLGLTIVVNSHLGVNSTRMTMVAALEQLVQASRAKIQEIRMDHPGRPIVLIGFNSGAALACQVAQMEHVTSIVCLGFPYITVDGRRGSPDDTLLDVRCPVMFVIGEKSVQAHVDDIEDLRQRMVVPTSLVVVGLADDQLRIPSYKKISEKICQNMIDRCVLDEMADFVGGILLQPHPIPLRSLNSVNNLDNRVGVKRADAIRKRKISTSSSVDSEPQSPNVKKARPNSPHQTNNVSGLPSNVLSKCPSATLTGTASTQTPKRKQRSYGNRNTYSNQLPSTRIHQSQNKDSTGGITLNFGSLTSLSPVGPIRFDPSSINLQTPLSSKVTGNTVKSTSSFIKVAKNNQVNVGVPQNVAKIKMILPTKRVQQRGPNNFKNPNISGENTSTPTMANVHATLSSISSRTSAPTATITSGLSATVTNLPSVHNSKNQSVNIGALTGKPITSSSILFTPKSSVPDTTSTITSTSVTSAKVSDISTHGSKVGFRGFQHHEQKSPVAANNTMQGTVKTRSPRVRLPVVQKQSPKSQVSRNIQIITKPIDTASSPISKQNNAATSLNEGLDNIFDIPIIIANDNESLNTYEPLSQATVTSPGNKMVLINNKNTDFEQLTLTQKSNQIEQKSVVLNRGSTAKPTVKYTRIILTKKNEGEEKSSPVILTKTRRSNKHTVQLAETNLSAVKKVPKAD